MPVNKKQTGLQIPGTIVQVQIFPALSGSFTDMCACSISYVFSQPPFPTTLNVSTLYVSIGSRRPQFQAWQKGDMETITGLISRTCSSSSFCERYTVPNGGQNRAVQSDRKKPRLGLRMSVSSFCSVSNDMTSGKLFICNDSQLPYIQNKDHVQDCCRNSLRL